MIVSPGRVSVSTGPARPSSAQARLPAIDGQPDPNADPYERVILIPVSASAASCTWPQSMNPTVNSHHHHTMLSVDFLPDAFRNRDFIPQVPRFLAPESAPEDMNNKLSTLEKEMMDRFRDLDVLKKEVQHLQSFKSKSQPSKPPDASTTGETSSLRRGRSASSNEGGDEVSRLRKDRRVMAELLKQSQKDLTKRDLMIGQLQRANVKLQQDLERLLESLTSDSPLDRNQDTTNQLYETDEETLKDSMTRTDACKSHTLECSQPDLCKVESSSISFESRVLEYKNCLREVVDAVAESPLASSCEIEGGYEIMKLRTCMAEGGHSFDMDRFQNAFRLFWRNVNDQVEAMERRTAEMEAKGNEKENNFTQLLCAKEQHLNDLMTEMRKVSVQLERQMETVMELHDESAALRRENERLVHQLEDTHIRKGLVQAKFRELQAKYNELQKEQSFASELLATQFRSQWQEQLEKVLEFLSHAEGKLSSKGRTANSIEEILRMRPCLTNKDVEKLEGAVLQVYENELQWIRSSLMDRENNNNEKYRNAITSPFKLEKAFDMTEPNGHKNYEQILLENVESQAKWKRYGVTLGSEPQMYTQDEDDDEEDDDDQEDYMDEDLEAPIRKDNVSMDIVDLDDLFSKIYFNDDLPDSYSDNEYSGGNIEDEDNPCSTFTINEEREQLETIPEAAEETSMSEVSSEQSKQPVNNVETPLPSPTTATSTTINHNPVFQELSCARSSTSCSSCHKEMIDPEDGTEMIYPESWDMTERIPIDLLKSSCDKIKRDSTYSPSRNTILYPMIEEEEEETGGVAKTEQNSAAVRTKEEDEVCQYYSEQCALEEEDALSVILETDSEEESELKFVVNAGDVISVECSGDVEENAITVDEVSQCDADNMDGGEAMADESSPSSCHIVEVRSAPLLMNHGSSDHSPEVGESSPENGERLTIVCTNCRGKHQAQLHARENLANGIDVPDDNKTEDDISTTFEDIIEEILNETDNKSKTKLNQESSNEAGKSSSSQLEQVNHETTEDFLKAAEAELVSLEKQKENAIVPETVGNLEAGIVDKVKVVNHPEDVHFEQRETSSQTDILESDIKEPQPSETSETQTEIVGNHLDDRLVELETAITEMQEVKEQHMKVACGVAEQLEELRSQENQWTNKEAHYKDEVKAWKDNVQLQNGLLQQLREDLDFTQEKLKVAETGAQDLKSLVTELQSRVVNPDMLKEEEAQTDSDYNKDLLLYIEQLKLEADEYREEVRKQEEVIQEVRQETERTMRHLQSLKSEAADKITKETSEWQRLIKGRDSEIKLLRGELLQLSELVEKKGVIISQQIQNIKDLLSELNRCETELHAKCKLLQELRQQRGEETSAQGAGQTEEEKLLSIGERCMREQHHQTLAQQGLLLDRLHQRLRALEDQLDLYTTGGQNMGASSSLSRSQLEEQMSDSKARVRRKEEGGKEEEGDDDVWSLAAAETASSEELDHHDYYTSVLEKAHRMTDQDVMTAPIKKTITVRSYRERPVPLPFKTGKIIFLQQDLENRRKEILKTEMKLRRIQAKMAEEVKKGRQPLKAT